MMVSVYGLAYWIGADDPVRYWPMVAVGLLGRTLRSKSGLPRACCKLCLSARARQCSSTTTSFGGGHSGRLCCTGGATNHALCAECYCDRGLILWFHCGRRFKLRLKILPLGATLLA